MKKSKLHSLVLLLAISIIAMCCVSCNTGDIEPVDLDVEYNEVLYATLQEAIDAAIASNEARPEVKLVDNVTGSGAIIETDKEIIFNLNGFSFILNDYSAKSDDSASGIVVKGNTKLIVTSSNSDIVIFSTETSIGSVYLSYSENVYAFTVSDNATVTVEGDCGIDAVKIACLSDNGKFIVNVGKEYACSGDFIVSGNGQCTVKSGLLEITGADTSGSTLSTSWYTTESDGEYFITNPEGSYGMSDKAKELKGQTSTINGFNTNSFMNSRVKKYDANLHGYNWMGYISDNQKIIHMSLPGTHDSCTYSVKDIYAPWARTQDLTLTKQFDRGVRVFDLRPSKHLNIYHGEISCNISLIEALDRLLERLNTNPTEGIVVILSLEENYDAQYYAASLYKMMYYYYNSTGGKNPLSQYSNIYNTSKGYSNPFIPFSADLTMGQLRGKIAFIFRDDMIADNGLVERYQKNSSWLSWSKNITIGYTTYNSDKVVKECLAKFTPYIKFSGDSIIVTDESYVGGSIVTDYDGYSLCVLVQDDSSNTFSGSKTRRIQYLFNKANAFNDDKLWKNSRLLIVNHTSGYRYHAGPGMSYSANAEFANEYAAEHLAVKGRLGFVMMDFAGLKTFGGTRVYGNDLVSHVWQQNFYQDRSEYYWTE